MKPWITLAARLLYPSPWRKRYGTEFQALLEDVNPGWRELFDVLGGALKMQLTTGATYWKLGAAFMIAGALIATVASFALTKEYTSTAVLRMTSDLDGLAHAEQKVLSRKSLAQIIQDPALDLYPSERAKQPLEDVVEYMRTRSIHINVMYLRDKDKSTAFEVRFHYPDKQKAQAVVRTLVARLAEEFEPTKSGQNLEILDSPTLPKLADSPKRPEMLITGSAAGLLLGLLSAAFIKHPRRSLIFAAMGLVGCLIGGASSLLIPNRYVSTAVIRVVPFDPQFEAILRSLARPNLSTRVVGSSHIPQNAAIQIRFTDTDPRKAQAMVDSVTKSLIAEIKLRQANVEYLDAPTYPQSPAAPNRYIISFLGLCVGLILATATLVLQRRRTPKYA